MSPRQRLSLFLIGAIGLAMMWGIVFVHLPGPAELRERYREAINGRTNIERNVTDAITAVNFDYRGFDTLGEEFILFASVLGALVLLQQESEKQGEPLPDALEPGRAVAPSAAMRVCIFYLTGIMVLFGLYVVIHGQLTPGGGFQGGVLLATAALMIYLGHGFKTFKKIVSHPLVEITEATGAAAFVAIGLLAWFWGQPYLSNTLPLGKSGELTSGGTIPLISFVTGMEVAGGFVLLLYAFLQETMANKKDE